MRTVWNPTACTRIASTVLQTAAAGLLLVALADAMAPRLLSAHSQVVLRDVTPIVILFGSTLLLASLLVLRRAGAGRIQAAEPQRCRSARRGTPERLPVASYSGPVDAAVTVTAVSPELESLLGYTQTEWLSDGHMWSRIVHREDRERVMAERLHHVESGERLLCEYRVMTRTGRTIWVRDEAVVVVDEATGMRFEHGVLFDITERKDAEEALRHQALHDSLTELPNRALLLDRLEQALRTARRTAEPVALLLMDLDRFKEVNDTFGHQYGDLLLRHIVTHLLEALRESDTVARLGGDEFAVLLPSVDGPGAILTAHKLLSVLRRPFEADGHVLDIGGSVGIALYPDHGRDAHTLLQRADVAMYIAKRSDNGYAVYEAGSDPHSPGRLALVRELRKAIESDQLVLHYQPKARFSTGATEHLEALVRWNHPERGFMAPDEFISLAEHAGLIKSLSVWVLNAAIRQCHQWHRAGLDISVAVNLSPRTLHDPELVDLIGGLLRRWNVDPRWLEVEITESGLMEDPAGAMETLTRLHAMGVCISIDDFGTGYSSLSYLTRLPADQIKIDKSFVLDMARNDDSAFIVRSVIDLGHNLSLEVVAEGVEDQETWDLLAGMGCDIAQGFHLSQPLPASEVQPWLTAPRSSLAFA